MHPFPSVAIILINVVVLVFVLRQRDRSRSGFFIVLNALSPILWAAGRLLYEWLGRLPEALALPTFAALIVPANFLYFAATRPTPLTRFWGSPQALFVTFAPSLFLAFFTDYRAFPKNLLGYAVRLGLQEGESIDTLLPIAIYLLLWIGGALALLVARYLSAPRGPDKNMPKHLIATIAGPLLFGIFFWLVTREKSVGILASPTLLAAMTAQVGLFVAIRQEEVERPAFLSRWVYYLVAALLGFFLVNLYFELLQLVGARIPLEPTTRTITFVGVGLMLLLASLKAPQAVFDRVLFRRAFEYRQLVLDAQRELRETRDRLRRAERLSMLGELSARVAHEIKNPLSPIKGYTQMLREKISALPEDKQRAKMLSYLDVIAEETEVIDRKVRQLLDIARRPEPVREELDANLVVERTATLLRLEIAATPHLVSTVSVDVRTEANLPKLSADRERLEEALFNLARNALEATGTEGVISIVTDAEDRDGRPGICIRIADSGRGFSQEALRNLFTPFFTEKEGGTGLGLTIARAHIEEHGGTLAFRNLPIGGAEAEIFLPAGGDTPSAADSREIPNVRQALERLPQSERPRAADH